MVSLLRSPKLEKLYLLQLGGTRKKKLLTVCSLRIILFTLGKVREGLHDQFHITYMWGNYDRFRKWKICYKILYFNLL